MSKEIELLKIIAEILEVDEVNQGTKLDAENWDSLAVISFISEVDSNFNIVLSPSLVGGASEVKNLIDLVQN
ncbi:phosphopantetheine-binding protein [Shewanella sp. 10N.286.51.B8]|uniref:phosphopantetheine-binding protein n=1 Tax=Shewanella sp. 10N.286.51.B8 TaxID=3229708 RepID=UPI00354B42C0